MAKLVLDDIGSTLTNTAATTINNNNTKIETALENTLSRDGTVPNNMAADIDMNSNDLLNVKETHTDKLFLNGDEIQFGNVTNALLRGNNLSDLQNVTTARNNLGLGSAALESSTSFLHVANSLSDVSSKPDARLNLVVPTYAVDRAAVKALNPNKDLIVYLSEAGRQGIFKWTLGNFSSQISADTQEGVYLKADSVASNIGAYVRDEANREELDVRWFGAIPDSTGVGFGTDSQVGLQAALSLSVVIGYDVKIVGTYRSSGTLIYDRTSLNSNFGRVPSIKGVSGASGSAIFFDAGVAIGLDVQGNTNAGVFGAMLKLEGMRLWSSGKTGSGLKIKDAAFIECSQIRTRGWNIGFLNQNVISSRFSPIFADGNVAGVLCENGPSAIPCNALTFENCWINGNDRIGYDLTNCAAINILGGSVEGNGIVTFGSSPNTSGGIRAVNCGQGGHIGVNVQGVYFEHNAGISDCLIFNDASLSSTSKMCSHLVQSNTFNRVHLTEFTTNPVRVSSTAVPQNVLISANGFGNLGTSGYVEDAARRYVAVSDAGNVITIVDDGSNIYTNSVAAPDFSNTFIRGSEMEAQAKGYFDDSTLTLSGARNVVSVTRVATGRYEITLKRGWSGRKMVSVMPDVRRTPYTFTLTGTTSVTIELQDGTTPANASFGFVVYRVAG